MSEIEKDPTEEQEKKFKDTEVIGDAKIEEFSGIEEKLSPNEKVELFVALKTDKGDKKLLVITNNRLLTFNNPKKVRLLGEKEKFRDIRLEDIQDITVNEIRDFDVLKVKTEKKKDRKFMVPEKEGVRIAGYIREIQSREKNVDPAEQLEKIGEQRDKGHITEEEFNEKKDELIDRI